VTGITDVRRCYMGCGLTRRHHVIMTTDTRALHFVVVHTRCGDRDPWIGRGMTSFTQVGGIDVVDALT